LNPKAYQVIQSIERLGF